MFFELDLNIALTSFVVLLIDTRLRGEQQHHVTDICSLAYSSSTQQSGAGPTSLTAFSTSYDYRTQTESMPPPLLGTGFNQCFFQGHSKPLTSLCPIR